MFDLFVTAFLNPLTGVVLLFALLFLASLALQLTARNRSYARLLRDLDSRPKRTYVEDKQVVPYGVSCLGCGPPDRPGDPRTMKTVCVDCRPRYRLTG